MSDAGGGSGGAEPLPTAAATAPPPPAGADTTTGTTSWGARLAATRAAERAFDVESWYPVLRECTFPTSWAPLTREDAAAMVAAYRWRFCRALGLTMAQEAALARVTRVATGLVAPYAPHGAFVRLSTRSPKDGAPFDAAGYAAARAAAEADLPPAATDDDRTNAALRAYFTATSRTMCVHTGAEAVELLLRSERVLVDLQRALDAEGEWEMAVICRRWDDSVDGEMEFRGFVWRHALTALSQYNHYIAIPRLAAPSTRAAIVAAVADYWRASVAPALAGVPGDPYAAAVVDFAVTMPAGGGGATVRVVELNPWAPTTGAALFNWTADAALLQASPPPAEPVFRWHAAPLPGMADVAAVRLGGATTSAEATPPLSVPRRPPQMAAPPVAAGGGGASGASAAAADSRCAIQ